MQGRKNLGIVKDGFKVEWGRGLTVVNLKLLSDLQICMESP